MYRPTEYETATITFPAEITARILVCVCLLGQSIGILIPHTSRNTPIRRHVASPEYMNTALGKGPPRVFHKKNKFSIIGADGGVSMYPARVGEESVGPEGANVCLSLTHFRHFRHLLAFFVGCGGKVGKQASRAGEIHTHTRAL